MNENTKTCAVCGCTDEELFELEINGELQLVCADCTEANGYVRCDDCGAWLSPDEAVVVHGSVHDFYVCPDCADSYFKCDDCDEYFTEDGVYTDGTNVVCHDCYEDNNWCPCEDCGSLVREDDIVPVNADIRYAATIYVCSDCASENYYQCDDCGDYYSESYVHRDDYGNTICDTCYERHDYVTCDDCGVITRDFEFNEHDDCYYCDSCADSHRRPRDLHDYSYKPTPQYQVTEGERRHASLAGISPLDECLTFGVELEVDYGMDAGDLCSALADLNEPIYMKHDGSLGSEGVEIVTHPCTLAFHETGLGWTGIMGTCRDNEYKSHDTDTCGLHVHVGRRGMGPDGDSRERTAANLVILADSLWDKGLVAFTRRKSGNLDHWAKRPGLRTSVWDRSLRAERPLDLTVDKDLRESALYTRNDGRYQAVNLTNAATVEFRIFRGTLKRDTLIAALQLVNNLTRYAMTHTPTECRNVKWADVIAVDPRAELVEFCAGKSII